MGELTCNASSILCLLWFLPLETGEISINLLNSSIDCLCLSSFILVKCLIRFEVVGADWAAPHDLQYYLIILKSSLSAK